MENIEKRYIKEIRAEGDTRSIVGTAIVFDEPSVFMGFNEIIRKEAVTEDLIKSSDIVFLYNHNDDFVPLARSKNGKGTLKISVNDGGVDFSFNAKKTSLGDEVLEAVRAGDLDACSFAFAVPEGGDNWSKLSDGNYLRTINKIDVLRDFSIVPYPAYPATSVNTRGLDELKAKEELEQRVDPMVDPEAEPETEPEDTPEQELNKYYNNYYITIYNLTH